MADNLVPPTEGSSAYEEFQQALKKFVKGTTNDNYREFIDNVLRPEGILSGKALEKLGAEARFRDRIRSAIPVGFGIGFAPASTVAAVLPSYVAKNLRLAIPANVATTALSALFNAAASKVVERGELGRKYHEQLAPTYANNEGYFLSFSATYPLARGIAELAGASSIGSSLARIWGGGLAGDAVFGGLNQGEYERRNPEAYPFLDIDKPVEESRAKIRALKQSYSQAVLGYLKDFGTALYRDPRNPNEKFAWNKNHLGIDVFTAIYDPRVLAATIALLPNAALGTAAGYVSNREKADTLSCMNDAFGALGWMQRDNVYRLAAKVFTRTRKPVPDIERGEEPRLPRLELTDTPQFAALPAASDFGGVLNDLSKVRYGSPSPGRQSANVQPPEPLAESPILRSSLRLPIDPVARLLETRVDLKEVACRPRSPSQESSHLEPLEEPLTESPNRSSPLSPAAQLPEDHASGQEARRIDTSRSRREQAENIFESVISHVNSDLEEINRKESRWWGIDVFVAALIPLVRSKQKERYALLIKKIMNKAAERMSENSNLNPSEEVEMVKILQRKLADWFTVAVKPGPWNLFRSRILANFNKVFGAEFQDLRAESNRGRSRIVKPIGSNSQLKSLAAQSLNDLRAESTRVVSVGNRRRNSM
jgi:hypothetical protein